jgi:hypothetical protein
MFARFCWKIIFDNNSIIVSSDVVIRQMWDDWKKIVWNLILMKKSGPTVRPKNASIYSRVFTSHFFLQLFPDLHFQNILLSTPLLKKKDFERWINIFSSIHHQIILLGQKKLSFINNSRRWWRLDRIMTRIISNRVHSTFHHF